MNALMQLRSNNRLLIGCVLISLAIFTVDLMIPLGVAGGVPYVVVVLLALRARGPAFPITFACVTTILTLLGLSLSNPGGIYWMVLANRGLALFVIWTSAILGLYLKRVQLQLLESEGRFQIMADQAPLMIWSAGSDFGWEFFSKGWLEFTGRAPELESGTGWQQGIHEEDRERFQLEYESACAAQDTFQIECRLQRSDGVYRWMLIHGAPRILGDGRFAGLAGICMDISDRKDMERELEDTRQRYIHREKMSAIGSLSAGLIHEIGNPIAGITGLVHELIEKEITRVDSSSTSDNTVRESLDMILEQLERVQHISQDVSNFSTVRDGGSVELQSFNDLVNWTCRLMHYDERMAGVELKLNLDRSLPAIRLATDHLIQVLLNLLSNAADACDVRSGGAHIVISTRMDSEFIVLTVEDDGCGMSPEVLARAQEAFYTTKPAGKGMGLGLALCNSIVSGYEGAMQIDSQAGVGTSVHISFSFREKAEAVVSV